MRLFRLRKRKTTPIPPPKLIKTLYEKHITLNDQIIQKIITKLEQNIQLENFTVDFTRLNIKKDSSFMQLLAAIENHPTLKNITFTTDGHGKFNPIGEYNLWKTALLSLVASKPELTHLNLINFIYNGDLINRIIDTAVEHKYNCFKINISPLCCETTNNDEAKAPSIHDKITHLANLPEAPQQENKSTQQTKPISEPAATKKQRCSL